MTESELLELFRRALRTSLAIPLVAGMGCSSSSSPSTPDADKTDTGVKADSGGDSGKKKEAGSRRDVGAPDAGRDGAVTPDSGRDAGVDSGERHDAPTDSGKKDAARRDAARDVAPPDAPDPCKVSGTACPAVLPLSCFDGGLSADAGFLTSAQCDKYCGPDTMACNVEPAFDGGAGYPSNPASLECFGYCNGRAHAGMAPPAVRGQLSPVGRYFAESAQLEAASIDAFRILEGELRAHDAPDELVDAAEVAARDEVRHARMTRRLARRYGPVASRRRAPPRPVRALADVAEENAVEGCVRETYAALLAHHQALAARDAEVRATMTRIAVDETRHAALAWKVAAWAEPRLDPEARARVHAARAAAVRELRERAAQRVPPPLTHVAGLPAADGAIRMLAVLNEALWAS